MNSTVPGIEFQSETNVFGFLIRYHLICAILVSLISSISFMIKPSVVPGRVGLLVTLFLVFWFLLIHNSFMTFSRIIFKKCYNGFPTFKMINSYISYFLIILELTSLKNLIILISDLSKKCVHAAMQLFYLQVC